MSLLIPTCGTDFEYGFCVKSDTVYKLGVPEEFAGQFISVYTKTTPVNSH